MGGLPEDQLDLAGVSLGDGSQACAFVPGTVDGQRYTSALSVSTGGLLFLQTIDGVDRAVETDSDDLPTRPHARSATALA